MKNALLGRKPTPAAIPTPDPVWTGRESRRNFQESSRAEDVGYTNLIGGSWRRDLPAAQYDRHLRVCTDLWRENPVAKKGIQNIRAFVAAEGFQVKSLCKDPDKRAIIQSALDFHFRQNRWKSMGGQRIETLAVEGEWDYAITAPNPITGHVRIAKINPEEISGIQADPMDAETMHRVHFTKARREIVANADGTATEYEHDYLDVVRRDDTTGRLIGRVLHLPINQLCGQTRGWSDLMVVADYLDSLDLLVVGEVDRHRLMKVFAWIVKLTGADPKTLEARKTKLRQEGPPTSGDLLITDGTEEWETKTPALNLQESVLFCEFLLMLIFGGLNMPQHWYSQGGDVNKATAGEMGTPVMAQVRSRKELIMEFILQEHEIAIFILYQMGILPPDITPADLAIEVLSRDPERNAYNLIGKMLLELGQALQLGQAQGWVTPEDAAKKFTEAAQSLGMGEFTGPATTLGQAQAIVTEAIARAQGKAEKEPEKIMRQSNEEFAIRW